MDQNKCFICAFDCSDSHFYLLNLSSKKYKTKYTSLISDLIDPEYELRVTNDNKICERCSVLIEKFDELQQETKTFKSVLGRQIAHTYNIGTSEPMLFMDKSKTFSELPQTMTDRNDIKYSCKLCQSFVTACIDTVNAHIMYHKLITEEQIHTNEVLKEVTQQKRNHPIRREIQKKPEPAKVPAKQTYAPRHPIPQAVKPEETKISYDLELPQIEQELPDSSNLNIQEQEYDEETMEQLIDLDLLDDPLCDSNLKSHQCMIKGCTQNFNYICDYIRHLKLKHRSTLNHIFAVVRANIKRPKRVHKLMCPYCFTKTASSIRLEEHVKRHEVSGKSNLFIDRVNEFVTNAMTASRCSTCDCEMHDTTAVECNHEIVRNGMAPRINCVYCSREFYSDKLYHNHLALDHGHCFICGSTCDDKEMLTAHIRSHLSHAEYSCAFCNDIYQTKNDRFEHMKLKHHEQCCMYCDEWFVEKDDLKDHIRYSHADKRMEEQKSCVCDTCGGSFKNKALFIRHQRQEHKKRKIYTCTTCQETFRYRFLLMDHMTTIHQRTIYDHETNFYKCFICSRGFSSQNRKAFIQHLNSHNKSSSFCSDCNVQLESTHHLEAHRERSHQDFSFLVDKLVDKKNSRPINSQPASKVTAKPEFEVIQTPQVVQAAIDSHPNIYRIDEETCQPSQTQVEDSTASEQFAIIEEDPQPEQQQIMVQTEDGSLLNMNNFILTENGELIIQDLEQLLPNGQEGVEDNSSGQIHISNLEQFLMEQGLAAGTEISYIQQPEDGQVNQIIIQNEDGTVSQSSQESLMQTYNEIFEPDGDIPTGLIASSEVHDGTSSQNLLLNGDGDYMVQMFNNDQVAEQIEIQNSVQTDANKSTLDELGDILLEVAAAAEKEKNPKVRQTKERETLWGKRKIVQEPIVNNGSSIKKRCNVRYNPEVSVKEEKIEPPASNFSQAYEFFVKGFDANKKKNL